MAIHDAAPGHYLAGNDCLVVLISSAGARFMVFALAPAATSFADRHLYDDADSRVFALSGKCRHRLPATFTTAGLLLHLCRGGRDHHERAGGKSSLPTEVGQAGAGGPSGSASAGAS